MRSTGAAWPPPRGRRRLQGPSALICDMESWVGIALAPLSIETEIEDGYWTTGSTSGTGHTSATCDRPEPMRSYKLHPWDFTSGLERLDPTVNSVVPLERTRTVCKRAPGGPKRERRKQKRQNVVKVYLWYFDWMFFYESGFWKYYSLRSKITDGGSRMFEPCFLLYSCPIISSHKKSYQSNVPNQKEKCVAISMSLDF